MNMFQRVLMVDPSTGFYKTKKYGLVGVEAGHETRIEFPIPDSSSQPDFVGKTATFDVTVHEIKAKVLPPIDDAFAENVGGFDSIDELRSDLREKMDAQKGVAQMQMKEREARSALAMRAEGDIPPAMIDSRTNAMMRDFAATGRVQGTYGSSVITQSKVPTPGPR